MLLHILCHNSGLQQLDHQWPYFLTLFEEVIVRILHKVGLRVKTLILLNQNSLFNERIQIVIVILCVFEQFLVVIFIEF